MKRKNKGRKYQPKKTVKKARGGLRSLAADRKKKKTAARSAAPLTVTGVFDYSGMGYGFCRRDGGEDVFIPAKFTAGAMTGDRVTVALRESASLRGAEGEVVSVDDHAVRTVIGTVVPVGTRLFVRPKNARLRVTAEIVGGEACEPGDLAEVSPERGEWFERREGRASEDDPLTGRQTPPLRSVVLRVFGNSGTVRANYAAVLSSSGIPTEFSREAEEEALAASKETVIPDGRADLRDEIVFTLDGAGAKDLDDAVSVKRTGDGYELGVHIADVSHYVREGGRLDGEARDRGTSVYFTDKVVPMLPKALSNGACSLNGGEDRYALTVRVSLDKNGVRTGAELYRSVIRSSLRGVYSEANDVLERGAASPFAEKYGAVLPSLEILRELAEKLREKRLACGSVELAEDEAVIVLDGDGVPVDVARVDRGVSERIIEQLMLEANIAAAQIATDIALPFVYRVHEDPSPEKLRDLSEALLAVGVDPHGIGSAPPASSWRAIRAILGDSAEISPETYDTVSGLVLRSMMKAKYSPSPGRHFGIGADLYCHFTSPIRRYPDLFVHRELSRAAGEGVLRTAPRGEGEGVAAVSRKAADAAAVSTDREIRAVAAEREIEALYIAEYMRGRIGEEFSAAVVSVTPFGVFARLPNTAEGLVPLSEFGDGAKASKSGAELVFASGSVRIGEVLRVRLTESDVVSGRLTFALAEKC